MAGLMRGSRWHYRKGVGASAPCDPCLGGYLFEILFNFLENMIGKIGATLG